MLRAVVYKMKLQFVHAFQSPFGLISRFTFYRRRIVVYNMREKERQTVQVMKVIMAEVVGARAFI